MTRTTNRSTAAQMLTALAAILGMLCLVALALMAWNAQQAKTRADLDECLHQAVYGSYGPSVDTCVERARGRA